MEFFCCQTVTSSTPGPITSRTGGFVGRPRDGIAQQLEVIDAQHLPKCAIDVPWKINHARLADLMQKHLRNVGSGHARKNFFHRQIGITRDKRQWRGGKFVMRRHVETRDTVDDSWSVFESAQQWMVRRRPDVPVAGRRSAFGLRRGPQSPPEQIGKAEVFPLHTPSRHKDWFHESRSGCHRVRTKARS